MKKLKRFISKYKDFVLFRVIFYIKKVLNDFNLLLATIVGYIPSHFIRGLFYRYWLGITFPWNSIIYWRCRFFNPRGVHLGQHSIVGNDAFLDGRKGLFIGNNVNIAGEVRIYTMEHDVNSQTFEGVGASVYIEDWVYIGTRVTILPGVSIGEGAVVASGAVVTKNVEPWTIVGGVPAKFLKNRSVVKYTLPTQEKVLFQ